MPPIFGPSGCPSRRFPVSWLAASGKELCSATHMQCSRPPLAACPTRRPTRLQWRLSPALISSPGSGPAVGREKGGGRAAVGSSSNQLPLLRPSQGLALSRFHLTSSLSSSRSGALCHHRHHLRRVTRAPGAKVTAGGSVSTRWRFWHENVSVLIAADEAQGYPQRYPPPGQQRSHIKRLRLQGVANSAALAGSHPSPARRVSTC